MRSLIGEALRIFQFVEFFDCEVGLAFGNRKAVLGVPDSVFDTAR